MDKFTVYWFDAIRGSGELRTPGSKPVSPSTSPANIRLVDMIDFPISGPISQYFVTSLSLSPFLFGFNMRNGFLGDRDRIAKAKAAVALAKASEPKAPPDELSAFQRRNTDESPATTFALQFGLSSVRDLRDGIIGRRAGCTLPRAAQS